MDTTPVLVQPKKAKAAVSPQECWHFCPEGISLACLERKAMAKDHDYPADWQHPVSHISKLDEFEKVCPDCKAAKQNGTAI